MREPALDCAARAAQPSAVADKDKEPLPPRTYSWEYRLPGCLKVLVVGAILLVLAVLALWLVGTAIFHGHHD